MEKVKVFHECGGACVGYRTPGGDGWVLAVMPSTWCRSRWRGGNAVLISPSVDGGPES